MTLFHDICKCPTSLPLRKSRGKSIANMLQICYRMVNCVEIAHNFYFKDVCNTPRGRWQANMRWGDE